MQPRIKDKTRTIIVVGDLLYSHELKCEVTVIEDEDGLAFDHELLSTGEVHRFRLEEERAKKMTVLASVGSK